MANAIRILTIDAVQQASSGHPGLPMGMADVATSLFCDFFVHWPQDSLWPNRDRFVLSAGHGCLLIYSLLYLLGYPSMPLEALKSFRTLHSLAPGHPEYGLGIEATTGPLGQGLANAVGMAVSQRMLAARSPAIHHHIYTLVSDGCLMEGISQEALSLAGHWRLRELTVLFDDNGISIDGATSLSNSDDILKRARSCGWTAWRIDGHDRRAIHQALYRARKQDRPTLIACRTSIGYGSPATQGTEKAHGSPLGWDEVRKVRDFLKWPSLLPFHIPLPLLALWRQEGKKHQKTYEAWIQKNRESYELSKMALPCPSSLDDLKKDFEKKQPSQATRASSGQVVKALKEYTPMVWGSADLGQSTHLLPMGPPFSSSTPEGRYLFYGVREHGMGAIMNGLALHGPWRPCASTFLTFSDYLRPAIRLAALMKLPVIYVFTHDSIGVGEDGPTHQPVEHLASLRAIPNLCVFRPCDSVETVECWKLALSFKKTPSVLCLTRQSVPTLRTTSQENKSASGAYVLREAEAPLRVDIWSTGSEVFLACQVKEVLEQQGWGTRVISFPSWFLFHPSSDSFLHSPALKVAIEAASCLGWHQFIGKEGLFFGVNDFGLSAPAQDVYKAFHLTVEEISAKIIERLNNAFYKDKKPIEDFLTQRFSSVLLGKE